MACTSHIGQRLKASPEGGVNPKDLQVCLSKNTGSSEFVWGYGITLGESIVSIGEENKDLMEMLMDE